MPSESVRRRRLAQGDHNSNNDRGPLAGRRKSSQAAAAAKAQQQNLLISFLCLITCVALLLVVFGYYIDVHLVMDQIAVRLGYEQKQYAVIIDAGSTGSRVLAYTFHRGYLDNRLILDSELFKEIKPGLSSFAANPKEGVRRIEQLLQEAKRVVPREFWSRTPLVLRATAGLRLLDAAKADKLLQMVRESFQASGFAIQADSVEIMDGKDEGIYSWFTINYLLGRLNGPAGAAGTVAALDLGGGSTQVTFVPNKTANGAGVAKLNNYIHQVGHGIGGVRAPGDDGIQVFTHSYLGLGLHAIRHAVFMANYGAEEEAGGDTVEVANNGTKIVLESECLNAIVRNKEWKYANKLYEIRGKERVGKTKKGDDGLDFEACLKVVREKVLPLVEPRPMTLNEQTIAAFSYFFERAIETGLIDPVRGGEIAVGDYYKMAKEHVCQEANVDQKFMCLDLIYIAVLLQDGYGLDASTRVKLYKKVNGHEISWALGCAYGILNK